MITEFLQYRRGQTVRDVLDDLRANANDYTITMFQYAYVVESNSDKLCGRVASQGPVVVEGPNPNHRRHDT